MTTDVQLDPVLLAVLAKRLDSIVREMTNTLFRTGRSTILAVVRDLSTSIVTADDQLLCAAEGLPIHTFGSHLQTATMRRLHPDLHEGDAFLDNDPYAGNTHHGDHTILVPVVIDGEHLFTTVAKAHQADCGNSVPTTYHPLARDLYEEGALCFPCVQVQREHRDIDDVIRMCRRRIRSPEQWYGDYLAMLGAARTGERRLRELVDRYGVDLVKAFVHEWLDYSERCAARAIEQLPAGVIESETAHDPFGPFEEEIPVRVRVEIDPQQGRIAIDLRDNIDAVPGGVNLSEACSTNAVMAGTLNVLGPDVPANGGAFRRISVALREGCLVGAARHPTCVSVATTNVSDRLMVATQYAFAGLKEGFGLAEGGVGLGPGVGSISGVDPRTDRIYVNSLALGCSGGPGTPVCDGWLTYAAPCGAGLTYRDSVEVLEQKYPMLVRQVRVRADSGGAGTHRGAPGALVEYGPKLNEMTVAYIMDGFARAPRGALGGGEGGLAAAYVVRSDGSAELLNGMHQLTLVPGERLLGHHAGGGGFGSPLERDPDAVLHDCREGYVSLEAAREIYGVVIERAADGSLTLDLAATERLRAGR